MWWTPWIAAAQEYAFKELGLRPHEFWVLTPGEFHALVAGHRFRARQRLEREAGWVCVIANSAKQGRGKTIRPEDLIGQSDEQRRALEEEIRRRKSKRKKQEMS